MVWLAKGTISDLQLYYDVRILDLFQVIPFAIHQILSVLQQKLHGYFSQYGGLSCPFVPHMLALNKPEECAKCVGYPPGIVHGELSDRQSFGPLSTT